jgi:hypothetical protein
MPERVKNYDDITDARLELKAIGGYLKKHTCKSSA